jgi:hypothetical protein
MFPRVCLGVLSGVTEWGLLCEDFFKALSMIVEPCLDGMWSLQLDIKQVI